MDFLISLSPEASDVDADLVVIPRPSWLLLGAPFMGTCRVYLFWVSLTPPGRYIVSPAQLLPLGPLMLRGSF